MKKLTFKSVVDTIKTPMDLETMAVQATFGIIAIVGLNWIQSKAVGTTKAK